MVSLSKELRDFNYREMNLPLSDVFPRMNVARVRGEFSHLKDENPHQTVFNVARELWNGGYEKILSKNGFWDATYATFSSHCHQCTPALGVVLKSLGLEHVSYLECTRIREHFPQTGVIEPVPPKEEPNPAMKEEFCGIGRIPYCCLEVKVDNENFYLTGKHVRPDGGKTNALLTPTCYREMTGVFPHPKDPTKSGIYLQRVQPAQNQSKTDFARRVVWKKQTEKDPSPEYFATFLRMKLI